ncbi:hypothetical protein PTKIN_Ptkin14bG0219600 [Pterospermum kingtungense]
MEKSSPHQVVLLPNSHNMLLLSFLITILIENVRTEQPNDVQQADQSTKTRQHYDFSDETAEKGSAEIAPAGLSELGQSSSQTRAPKSNISYPLNSPTEVEEKRQLDGDQIIAADQQQIEITLPRSVIERMLLQNMAAEAETEAEAQQQDQKNGLKISCLVISVSTTGILSFLTGFPRSSQSTMTSKPLFKAGLVSMIDEFGTGFAPHILPTYNMIS